MHNEGQEKQAPGCKKAVKPTRKCR